MNKMNNYIKSKSTLLFLIAGLVASFVVVFMPKTAIAAPAGCYSKNMNGAVATTTSVTCPSNEPSKTYSSGCWLKNVDEIVIGVFSDVFNVSLFATGASLMLMTAAVTAELTLAR